VSHANTARKLNDWLYAGFFSLNLAWALVWPARIASKQLGGPVGVRIVSALSGWAYQLVSPIGGFTILEQVTWTLILASMIFLLLRMFSLFVEMTDSLQAVAGLICITAFPFSTRRSLFIHPFRPGLDYHAWLLLELAVVLICAGIYFSRKQLHSRWIMLTILLFHFVVWALATSSYFNFLQIDALRNSEYYHPWPRTLGVIVFGAVFNFGFPILGFLASATWVLSIRQTLQETRYIGPDIASR
jgi:hypothetical protein